MAFASVEFAPTLTEKAGLSSSRGVSLAARRPYNGSHKRLEASAVDFEDWQQNAMLA